jgi:hypothetical protein
MRSQLAVILVLALTAFLIWGCSENPVNAPDNKQAGSSGPIQLSHAQNAPFVTDLLAGQTIDVGDVEIWNDGTNLHVTYKITDLDWCITETHLAVATSLGEIPHTGQGSPIPGQFPYTHEDLNCATEDSYTIPLTDIDAVCDDDVYIAAHAVVVRLIEGCWETVWQIGDVEQSVEYPEGTPNAGQTLLTNYADEFNWQYPLTTPPGDKPYTAGYTLAENTPAYTNPFIVGTTPTAEFPYNSNYNRGYATDFDVQWEGSLPYGGRLIFSWSPGQSAAETKVITDGGTTTVNRTGTPISGMGYFLDTYPVYEEAPIAVGPYGPGTHTINFKHTKGDGTFWDWIRLEKPCVQEETAWGDGDDFPGNNWATSISYTIQCCKIYLSESFDGTGDGSIIYTVSFEGGNAVLTEEIDLQNQTKWDKPHLAVHPNTGELYLINNGNGTTLGVWDGMTLTELGPVADLPNYNDPNPGTVLAAFSEAGELYVANNATNKLYKLDTSVPEVAMEWNLPGVDVQGADMAFINGELYLWSNANDGLWKITLNGGNATTEFLNGGNLESSNMTGLAYGSCTGDALIGSSASENGIYEVSTSNGSLTNLRNFMLDGSPYDYIYGDMASGF